MGTDGTGGCMTSCRTARSWPPRLWPSGDAGSATITLQNGVPCTVEVNTAGAYGNEVSWTLSDASGNVVASMDGQDESFPSPNTLVDVVTNDPNGEWSMLGTEDDWTVLDDAYLYFPNGAGDTIRDHVTVGQGAFSDLIGPELMFAHQLDTYYEDPVLIIKTAWGGLSLAEDFRPPSAGGAHRPLLQCHDRDGGIRDAKPRDGVPRDRRG